MKKLASTIFAACTFLFSANVMASPVSLGSIKHLYGTDTGRQLPSISALFHQGGNCDTASANTITVKATKASKCNRFADAFDFSGINYESIDHFELTLDFIGAQNQKGTGFFGSAERWNVRGASNYVQSAVNFGPSLNANGTQTFLFENSKSLFNDIVSANNFFVSFATNSGAAMNFNLNSAKLEVFGTAPAAQVPEPGSLALMGLSLAALVGVQRRRKTTKV